MPLSRSNQPPDVLGHPLQLQDRVVPRAGVEPDQDEPGKVPVNAEMVARTVALEAKRGP